MLNLFFSCIIFFISSAYAQAYTFPPFLRINSAEYHQINSAMITQGHVYKAEGFYLFNKEKKIYGGSLSNRKDIPLALTWIWNGSQHYQALSIAGKLSKKWFIGAGIRNFSKKFFSTNNEFFPHLAWLYKLSDHFLFGLTGDRIDEKIVYGLNWYSSIKKVWNIQGYIRFNKDQWNICSLLEWMTKDKFSLRIGQSWPNSVYHAGISLLGNPIILDYEWIQKKGHRVSILIHSNF